MVRVVTVNISDFKTTSMRIRTAVIVTIVTVPGYIVIRTDGWAIIFDTVNRTVSLNLITNIFKTTSGIFTERNFRIVATKTMQHACVFCPIATFFPVIIFKFVYSSFSTGGTTYTQRSTSTTLRSSQTITERERVARQETCILSFRSFPLAMLKPHSTQVVSTPLISRA